MYRKPVFSTLYIALILSISALAHADSITFSFFSTPVAGSFQATAAGITTSTSGFIAVTGGTATTPIFAPGSLVILESGSAPVGSFTNANLNSSSGVQFSYGAANLVDVEVFSEVLCGGVCVTGQKNEGILLAPTGTSGSFLGTFAVNTSSVSPTLLAILGFEPDVVIQVSGSDSLDTANDSFNSGTHKESANFAGGDVTISVATFVPEPGSFLLFGSGLLGMAGMIRRKLQAVQSRSISE